MAQHYAGFFWFSVKRQSSWLQKFSSLEGYMPAACIMSYYLCYHAAGSHQSKANVDSGPSGTSSTMLLFLRGIYSWLSAPLKEWSSCQTNTQMSRATMAGWVPGLIIHRADHYISGLKINIYGSYFTCVRTSGNICKGCSGPMLCVTGKRRNAVNSQ